jgi:Family of unknown function (DUF5908)
MPIVVDEVVISVEVTGGESGGAGGGGGGAEDRQALVEECVERVLEILRRKEER